ncbi:hypothetical protein V475_23170 [Sphingobium baderi LL03]|nr:hypothetical protein V475_23170 [Sphingobium baderi LL03]
MDQWDLLLLSVPQEDLLHLVYQLNRLLQLSLVLLLLLENL